MDNIYPAFSLIRCKHLFGHVICCFQSNSEEITENIGSDSVILHYMREKSQREKWRGIAHYASALWETIGVSFSICIWSLNLENCSNMQDNGESSLKIAHYNVMFD